jgi:hypothetical protein
MLKPFVKSCSLTKDRRKDSQTDLSRQLMSNISPSELAELQPD